MSSRRILRIAIPVCAIVLSLAAERPLLADASYKETTQITGGSLMGMMKKADSVALSSNRYEAQRPALPVTCKILARVRWIVK